MPPREATGSFPDQFLLFDYDTVVARVVPPIPVAVAHTAALPPPAHNNSDDGNISGEAGPTTEAGSGALSPVDPLSIDPTSDQQQEDGNFQDLPWSSANGEDPTSPFPTQTVFTQHPPPSLASSTAGDSSPLSSGSMQFYGGSPSWHSFTPPAAVTVTPSSRVSTLVQRPRPVDQPINQDDMDSSIDEDDIPPSSETAQVSNDGDAPEYPNSPGGRGPISSVLSSESEDSTDSLRRIYRNVAFDGEEGPANAEPLRSTPSSPSSSGRAIMLSFGPNTTVDDLKYFAERGCIVALLQALKTDRLVTLGTRMLADYAKMAHRRVAVAANKRILDFVQRTMLQTSDPNWMGREYAVETIRSLTATEASDPYLMSTPGLLKALATVSIGGPFVTESGRTVSLASEKAQLHACIAIMNLSCGKANKMEIAQIPAVLEAMRDVMLGSNEEACLKATTCIKNLSNADANDAALLATPGLVEALGHVAATTCVYGATVSTTNACLALMNLSISKGNKHKVFCTPGVMEALMLVLERTQNLPGSTEARIKACSALSNLAIGYDNKIPMFHFPGFVTAILNVIQTDKGEARTKACSILWSFAAEIKNQVPVVERGDILPVLVRVAQEDVTTEARFKCVAALTLLAESLENAVPLLQAGALVPLMDILQQAGADPTQWKGQTASWCVGFLMNISQSDKAVFALRQAGVVELLAPLLTLDHYQSLKAAMAVTFCCRFDKGDECYDLLRKTETVIPKIVNLLHNTLAGRGGNGYKYGVFTLRSSVGCIAALACGPDFTKERIATPLVFESLLRVVSDFCVDGGTGGAIVGGGRDDVISAKLAVQALQALTAHLIPTVGSASLPFEPSLVERLLTAYEFYIQCPDVEESSRQLAADAKYRMETARAANPGISKTMIGGGEELDVVSMASTCCGALEYFPGLTAGGDDDEDMMHGLYIPSLMGGVGGGSRVGGGNHALVPSSQQQSVVRTFLLADSATGLRFVVPTDPSGGRFFNDTRLWCYRRGRYCVDGEHPDPAYVWTPALQRQYEAAVASSAKVNPTNSHSREQQQ